MQEGGARTSAIAHGRPVEGARHVAVEAHFLGEDQPARAADAPAVAHESLHRDFAHGDAAVDQALDEGQTAVFLEVDVEAARQARTIDQWYLKAPSNTPGQVVSRIPSVAFHHHRLKS